MLSRQTDRQTNILLHIEAPMRGHLLKIKIKIIKQLKIQEGLQVLKTIILS